MNNEIPVKINTIEQCIEQERYLKEKYSIAQKKFINENIVDSELYVNCINRTQAMIKFLDEQTTFFEDLKVIWKCPKGIFIRAFFRVFFKI